MSMSMHFRKSRFPTHLQLVSELAHNLACYILDPCNQAVSMLSMRTLGLLLTHVAPAETTSTSSNDCDYNNYNASDVVMNSSPWFIWWKRLVATDDKKEKNILLLWEVAAVVILDRRLFRPADCPMPRRIPPKLLTRTTRTTTHIL
jgi:hypothetical protein